MLRQNTVKNVFWCVSFIYLTIILSIFYVVLSLNGGVFTYMLDDAYIHLSLAERILSGHYGINYGEFSSPASSILWPFLLAPFVVFKSFYILPFFINAISVFAFIVLLIKYLDLVFERFFIGNRFVFYALFSFVIISLANLVVLNFAGMEHSLQILISMLLIYGVVKFEERGVLKSWVPMSLILGPLIRYENLALSVPIALYLLRRGEKKAGLFALFAIFILLGSFSAFLYLNSGYLFPYSVIVKTGGFVADPSFAGFLERFFKNISSNQGILFIAVSAGILISAFYKDKQRVPFSLAMTISAALYLMFGQFVFLMRYSAFLWVVLLLALIYTSRCGIAEFIQSKSSFLKVAVTATLICITLVPLGISFHLIPLACNNIYEQHYQMHRFVKDYIKAPYGVNDLGFVSFRNRYYVLDYVGLASKEVLDAKVGKYRKEWMEKLAARHNVNYIMVYKQDFENIPSNWIHLGNLKLTRPKVTAAHEKVAFYYRGVSLKDAKKKVRLFIKTLPSPKMFELFI